jgi:uncharacterized protein
MRKFILVLAILGCATFYANAQQSVAEMAAQAKASKQALPADAPSRDQVLKFFDILQVRRNMQLLIDGMKEQMKSGAEQGFRHKLPDATPGQIQQMQAIVDDSFSEISFDELIDAIVPVYQRHLSKSDIDNILAFYASAAGQKLLREQPAIMRESMEVAGAVEQKKMDSVLKKLDDRMDQLVEQSRKSSKN